MKIQYRRSARLAFLPLLALAPFAAAQSIYYADLFNPTFDDGGIWHLGDPSPLVNVGSGLRGITVDAAAGKIYWADVNNFSISRANLDGTNVEPLVTSGLTFPAVLAIDTVNHRLLWGDQGSGEIWTAGLDGSGPSVLTSTPFHRGLAVDAAHQKLYWSTSLTSTTGNIVRSDLDGSNPQIIVTGVGKPATIALDVQRNRMYWTDYTFGVVRYSDLNGGNPQALYTDPFGFSPRGIAVDTSTGDVYFGLDTDETGAHGSIQEAVGGEPIFQGIASGLGGVISIAIPAATAPPCYPNCDGSTTAPILNVNDFICFQGRFAAGDTYANCDGSTQIPVLNVNDFICFQSRFAAGCP